MKSFQELKKEFDTKVVWLQKHCKHEKSEWMAHEWAPGHSSGEVLVCLFCNKDLEYRITSFAATNAWWNTITPKWVTATDIHLVSEHYQETEAEGQKMGNGIEISWLH